MKVLFVSFEYPPNIIGGLGTYADYLVEGLRNKGVKVYVIAPGYETDGQDIYRISYWGRYFFTKKALSIINDLNKYEKFDLVHFNGAYPITRSLAIPTVCTFHSTYFHEIRTQLQNLKSVKSTKSILDFVLRNPIGNLFDITMAQISDQIICPCLSLAREVQSYCFDKQKVHVIPNGVDPETFDRIKPDATLLNKYGIDNESYLLYMGRLTALKGVEYLIEAFKIFKKESRKLKLVIVGKGSSEAYLRRIALDVEDVIFVGFIDSLEVKKLLYQNSLAVILPSVGYEVLPMVVLEAMACGRPVIASNVGGVHEMIKQGKNGFLVRPKDPDGLVNSIKCLYENPNLSKKMGMFGRKLLENEFTVDKMVSRTLEVYKLFS